MRTIALRDGRTLTAHDTGEAEARLTLLWHHGSPQTGALLSPLVAAAGARGIRLVSYGRPSYGGSSAQPGRSVRDAAADVAQLADALGIGRFATMGASGGGPHALACAAGLPGRVSAVAVLAGIAPFSTGFDWLEGMVAPGGLRAALEGREARARFAETETFDANSFVPADHEALEKRWGSLGADAGAASHDGPDGLIDDDVAFAKPWGFDLAEVTVPTLFVQGGLDRVVPPSHAHWQLRQVARGELWLRPRDGHVSVLDAVPVAMDWLLANGR
jgi:pimeloyl-ACP methyl ester carboxylesterase